MAQNEIAGYRPQGEWPTLEEMADGFSEHLMPASTALAGKSVEHILTNGWCIRHEFQEDKLTWTILEGEDAGKSEDYKELVTLLHNTSTGELKICLSGFVDKENGERRTWTKFIDAIKAGDKHVAAYETTMEMVGKHVLYRYTPRDAYQHFYVSPGTLMWHCVAGTELDVADADKSLMFKLADSLYLLFWSETVMPVESIVVIDLQEMRSTGRFLCWDPKPQSVVHVRFGSQATLLNQVEIAAELAKPLRS